MTRHPIIFDDSDYIDKKNQIIFFIKCTKKIANIFKDTMNPYGNYLKSQFKSRNEDPENFITILRSNAILMIYNCIESTVLNVINNIYQNINNDNLVYTDLIEEFQNIWRDYQYSNHKNHVQLTDIKYKHTADNMITKILNCERIQFQKKDIKLSGNADYKSIKKLLKKHTIELKSNQSQDNFKNELFRIKDRRNNLAHGTESFIEVGRNISDDDLLNTSKYVFRFLERIIYHGNKLVISKSYLKREFNN